MPSRAISSTASAPASIIGAGSSPSSNGDEHPVRDVARVAASGTPDAEPHAQEVARAHPLGQRAQAVVARQPATLLRAHAAERRLEIVVHARSATRARRRRPSRPARPGRRRGSCTPGGGTAPASGPRAGAPPAAGRRAWRARAMRRGARRAARRPGTRRCDAWRGSAHPGCRVRRRGCPRRVVRRRDDPGPTRPRARPAGLGLLALDGLALGRLVLRQVDRRRAGDGREHEIEIAGEREALGSRDVGELQRVADAELGHVDLDVVDEARRAGRGSRSRGSAARARRPRT